MQALGALSFLHPWLLAGLIALPILWWLLRAIPPAARRISFPGVMLLKGLREHEVTPARTPWWLLALRMLALAAAIIAFAEPVLHARSERGTGPLLILLDGGWGDAPDWSLRQDRVSAALRNAARDGRITAVLRLNEPPPQDGIPWQRAAEWLTALPNEGPAPLRPRRADWASWLSGQGDAFDTLWISDGLDSPDAAKLARALADRGQVELVRPATPAKGLARPRLVDGALTIDVLRAATDQAETSELVIFGQDPTGVERAISSGIARFDAGEPLAELRFDLPAEIRNRVTRIELAQARSAAGVVLAGDATRRRKVGLLSGSAGSETKDLNDPLNYLRKAMVPFSDTIEAPLDQLLQAAPDVLVLADVASFAPGMDKKLLNWIEEGGVLIRFSGPRLARASQDRLGDDPLLPVRLRAGGRILGGAMSWGVPRRLRPLEADGPFGGLALPDDIEISALLLAQPDPDLPDKVWAALDDGTPLVTGVSRGQGRIVLFHTTASADWSNLPLSGLFIQMLERLVQSAGWTPAQQGGDLAQGTWMPEKTLDGFGEVHQASNLAGVSAERLAVGPPAHDMPPGLYRNETRRAVLNALGLDESLTVLPSMPGAVVETAMIIAQERAFKPWLLMIAIAICALDVLATLLVTGRLRGPARATAVMALAVLSLALTMPPAQAQETDPALLAAHDTVLAYVETGDAQLDRISRSGLAGLGHALAARTAIEPGPPVAVDLERDDLTLLPLIYWPILETAPTPSDAAFARLNAYLRAGGMILFDTRDGDLAGIGGGSVNTRALQRIAQGLDVPPLEPVPSDHVLTRTFYLLQDFPGRWRNAPVWLEASPAQEAEEGMPFRILNDGVTPVIIGGNDWASAWAMDEAGRPMFPVGRGLAGERQREMALRFGINLVMYVMTGNYKSDQVHVPALLDRLGE